MSAYREEAAALVASRPGFAREIARQMNARKALSAGAGGLTARQRELLLFIRRHIGEHGIAPSFDQMKDELGLASKGNIHRLVRALSERGFIEFMPNRARAIRLRGAL